MKKKLINNKKKGFSIIEILVAMAITLILLSIMAPKYMAYRDKAKELKAVDLGRKIYSVYLDSFMNEGGYDAAVLKVDINTMLGIAGTDITLSDNDDPVTIEYPCDGEEYSVEINKANGNFEVKHDSNEIYSSNQYSKASEPSEPDAPAGD
ncbi:type II secretion system protein [Clostridium grantii]|uniref:Type IV pilin N-term methylation site GFxxxE n=1 Tax=Clostridium grantii DSM 8605 TaxID=1121316 RepID=A0A1M5SGG1_9CLOT|nr:type II secretion system protein [Clostridium grantii]SHH37569.1 Type IV pilin N-term methylation site GFxxxE [Clostridium grantii DSM 8605]